MTLDRNPFCIFREGYIRMNAPISQILPRLPFWANLSTSEKEVVSQRASTKRFAKGQLVSSNSSSCLGIVLILHGSVRVSLVSDEGREITLFRTGSDEIKKTQEEIALDVNSAREVVARMLHEFSARGLVELKRGAIKLRNIDALRKIG